MVTTLDRLGRDTSAMLELARDLREQRVGLRVLNLVGDAVDTSTPTGELLSPCWSRWRGWNARSNSNGPATAWPNDAPPVGTSGVGKPKFTDRQIERARRAIAAGDSATEVAADLGMSRATLYRRLKSLPAQPK